MGPQLTAEDEDSVAPESSTSVTAEFITHLLPREQHKQDDDRDWNPQQPKQYTSSHSNLLLLSRRNTNSQNWLSFLRFSEGSTGL
ncbi:DUF1524 domain-containing protein [Mesorhizobium sp. LCM 4576]|uniref:GmrSD restriction endonuclease domain-containing protein n=1 Tax=Mesorhizobium sp. LCM 4576 TaxID=1848289 RepID=UPI00387EE168